MHYVGNKQIRGGLADFLGQAPTAMGTTPGLIETQQGPVMISNIRDDYIYDMVEVPVTVTAGASYSYFSVPVGQAGKTFHDTSMNQPSRLPNDQQALIYKIGIHVLDDEDQDDIGIVINRGYVEFTLGDTIVVRHGPVFLMNSGHGSYGYSALDNQAAATERTIRTNGVPGTSAVLDLRIPIYIAPDDTFNGTLIFYTAQTLSAATSVYMILSGLIERAVR